MRRLASVRIVKAMRERTVHYFRRERPEEVVKKNPEEEGESPHPD
jgi:hypothetical protein